MKVPFGLTRTGLFVIVAVIVAALSFGFVPGTLGKIIGGASIYAAILAIVLGGVAMNRLGDD